MAKSVTFTPNPRSKPDPAKLDAFVQGGAGEGAQAEQPPPRSAAPAAEARPLKAPMKRLTFDIDAALHKRIRLECVGRGVDMAEVLRDILAERFPEKS